MLKFYVVKELNPEMIAGISFLNAFNIRLKYCKLETVNQLLGIRENWTNKDRENRLTQILNGIVPNQLLLVLKDYKDVFMAHKWDLGKTNFSKHKINTDSMPIKLKPFRQPKHFEDKLEETLENLIKYDVIEKCQSEWNFPLVCIWKKEKKEIRVCVDFRHLNKVTSRPAFPMPNIEDMLDALNGSKYFSTIDLGNAYYQVELDVDSRDKTAFSTKHGQYRFKRMPFGIAAAPATFQELMHRVLGPLNWKEALVYLDDILIFSSTKEEHMERIRKVLQRIRESGLRINPEKCEFMKTEVKFLGHILDKNGIAADPEKVKAIESFKKPNLVKQLRSFLGLANYYRRFIKNYSQYSKLLEGMCGKDDKTTLNWTEELEKTFEILRSKLVQTPVLNFPDFDKQFILDTDASFDCIGAVLSQKDEDGFERVIAYGSHKMSKHEVGYCITRKELLAIYYFCQHFKHYLYGRRFLLRTDHKAITFMLTTKKPITQQFQTWINFLSGLDIDIVYRKGDNHVNADALSRLDEETCNQCQMLHENPKRNKIKTRVLALSESKQGIKWQNDSEEIKSIIKDKVGTEEWKIVNNVVLYDNKIWIPEEKREEFIEEIHKMLCHAGYKKSI